MRRIEEGKEEERREGLAEISHIIIPGKGNVS